MDDPPAQSAPNITNDGPRNAMLVEKGWRPTDGIPISPLLTAGVHGLGNPVDEGDRPVREFSHDDQAAENCSLTVEWEDGTQISYLPETGWTVKEAQ